MNKIIYVTDLHGDLKLYEKFLDLSRKKEIKALIIGGDICPTFDLNFQRDFILRYLIPRLEKFKNEYNKPVFIMMGNDDFNINMDLLEKAEQNDILKISNMKVHKILNKFLIGYSYVPAPFFMRDWVKLETEIEKDLEKLVKKTDPKKTIYSFHVPPFKTKLDVLYNGEHVGSTAVLNFIKKYQPLLTLHGHIHEAPDFSGAWKINIGKTISINPGIARFVIFDSDLKEIKLK